MKESKGRQTLCASYASQLKSVLSRGSTITSDFRCRPAYTLEGQRRSTAQCEPRLFLSLHYRSKPSMAAYIERLKERGPMGPYFASQLLRPRKNIVKTKREQLGPKLYSVDCFQNGVAIGYEIYA